MAHLHNFLTKTKCYARFKMLMCTAICHLSLCLAGLQLHRGRRCPDCQLHSTLLLLPHWGEGTLTPPWWHRSRRDYRPWYSATAALYTHCPLTKIHRLAASSVQPGRICLLMFVQEEQPKHPTTANGTCRLYRHSLYNNGSFQIIS